MTTRTTRLPGTIPEAVDQLAAESALVMAKEWHRAALVYAIVGPAPAKPGPKGKSSATNSGTLTVDGLARKGIVGLATHTTIERYRDAWQIAVDKNKAKPVTLGDPYVEPDLTWPPSDKVAQHIKGPRREALLEQAEADGVGQSKVLDVAQNPKAVVAAIKADPKLADAIEADPDASKAVMEAFNRTEAAKATGRSIKRAVKRHEAEESGPKYLRLGLATAGSLMELGGWLESIVEECTPDPEGAEAARLIIAAIEYRLNLLKAWAGGDLEPLPQEEFERQMAALLGSES